MRKSITLAALLLAIAAPAHAADPVLEPAPEPAPVALWSGFYAGGQLGWSGGPKHPDVPGGGTPTNPSECEAEESSVAWVDLDNIWNSGAIAVQCGEISAAAASSNIPAAAAFAAQWEELMEGGDFELDDARAISGGKKNSFIGGVHVGYNHQFESNFVLGAVADINMLDWNRWVGVTDGNDTLKYEQSLRYLGTVRAKAGFAADRVFAYATGGLAFGGLKSEVLLNGSSVASEKDTRFGYSVGAGVDFLATDNLSVGAEYLYNDLSKDSDDLSFHTLFVKASYHFR